MTEQSAPGDQPLRTHRFQMRAPDTAHVAEVPSTEPRRFYVPTDTCGTVEGSRIGVAWLMRQARESRGEPLVVVPSEAHSYRNEYLSAATSQLRWTTTLAYRAAAAAGWLGGPTLLVFPDPRVLGWFDRHPKVTGLCVVQGVRHNTTAWATAYRPEDLTTGLTFEGRIEIDAVVAEAMRRLRLSDRWRGLTAAADISLAVRTLRLLRKGGHRFCPEDLEAWALAERWTPSAATRLRVYATKVATGQLIVLRSLDRPTRGALHQWRQAAASAGSQNPEASRDAGSSTPVPVLTDAGTRVSVDQDHARRVGSAVLDERPRRLIRIEAGPRDGRQVRIDASLAGVGTARSYRR